VIPGRNRAQGDSADLIVFSRRYQESSTQPRLSHSNFTSSSQAWDCL